ncbi:hypothetical protein [Neobacillus sp. LXY-1]|uniref:hypothetical protein n=1 Tax=Neobacillus sp. LXY-1 TaxID=3379133 RepID=UPI003EE33A22
MKRGDFLKEMAGSLFHTVKSVYEPFLSDDLEKMEEAADKALGISWIPLMNESELYAEVEMKFLNGKPIIVSKHGENLHAVDGICPECSNIIFLASQYSTGKCLNCEKDFNFKSMTGELRLDSLPLKLKDHQYYIGIQTYKRQGGSYA